MDVKLSDAEKVFLIHGVEHGCRNDGRSIDDYRPIILERGVLASTDGSARIRLDTTDLLIGVKPELQTVDDSSKVENHIRFSVDCSANASPQFEGKGGEKFAEDIVSALESCYDNDIVLPEVSRLIVSKNHVWIVYVDVVILQFGGSIIDAVSIGVKAALSDLEIAVLNIRPADANRVTVELPDAGDTWSLDINNLPLILSVNKIGTASVVDCNLNEEVCVRSSLWVGVCPPPQRNSSDDSCVITLVRQMAGGSLERQSIEEMCDLAIRVSKTLHTSLNERLSDEKPCERPTPGFTFLHS